MKRKYGILGFVAAIYQVLGFLSMIVGGILLVVGVVALVMRTQSAGQELLIPSGLASLVSGLLLVGFGQLLNLLRDMELNTRRSAAYMLFLAKQSRARRARAANNARASVPRTNAQSMPREEARG